MVPQGFAQTLKSNICPMATNQREPHSCATHSPINPCFVSVLCTHACFSTRKGDSPSTITALLVIFLSLVLMAILSSLRFIPYFRGHLSHGHCAVPAPQGRARKLTSSLNRPHPLLGPATGENKPSLALSLLTETANLSLLFSLSCS